MTNYYILLGTYAGASTDEIRARFRSLAWTLHPDRQGAASIVAGLPSFMDVQKAYATLRYPASRRQYDAEQVLRNILCPYCIKGATYRQRGFIDRVAIICLRCNGSGYRLMLPLKGAQDAQ